MYQQNLEGNLISIFSPGTVGLGGLQFTVNDAVGNGLGLVESERLSIRIFEFGK